MQHVNGNSTLPPPAQQINFKLPEVKPGANEAEMDLLLLWYERIEATLQGSLSIIDAQPDEEACINLARMMHAFAKLLLANVTFIRELDGVSLKLSDPHRERLTEVEDGLDDVVDTLDWTVQGRDALKALVAEELSR